MADPGEGPRGLGPPLFLDENEARRADNSFFEAGPPLSQGLDDRPPPPYLKVWIRHWYQYVANTIVPLRHEPSLFA